MVEAYYRCKNCGCTDDNAPLHPCDNPQMERLFIISGADVQVLKASNFFDLFKVWDGTLESLGSKPLHDAQTGARPMIAARDAKQAPDHAASEREAETPKAPCAEHHIRELRELLGRVINAHIPGQGIALADWERACLLSGRFGQPMPDWFWEEP